ncbi:serine/threonine-protein kinase [Gilvimarinus agarilyticus]|uniref:serine/threonine-protein kinase n=1 Tax=Gilvimarinus agarilyticus TaxID=679259 RepID=UPI0005A110FB|nr:serine/threonine-protein kinase [Gilvimarinus agarilyticus]
MTTHPLHTDTVIASRYRIERIIGQGGMGQVYLAWDEQLERRVAIKRLREDGANADHLERLQREAKFLAKLNHPCIVQIYDFIEEPGGCSLVMEYVEGANLAHTLREACPSTSERLQWLHEIAAGLACAHTAGILHRDLKPENIIINRAGHAKLTDFGIARELGKETELTQAVIGSYAFMSPEQITGESLDFRSDLFSFGLVAYYVLFNAHPFGTTNNALKLLQDITHTPLNVINLEENGLPPELVQLLAGLLAKQREQRPQSSQFVCDTLNGIYQYDLTTRESENWTQVPAPVNNDVRATLDLPENYHAQLLPPPASRRRKWPALLGAAAVVIVATVVAVVYFPFTPQAQAVAVLPPTLAADNVPAGELRTISGTVYQAATEGALRVPYLDLIPRFEVEGFSGSPQDLLAAVGARELITSSVYCERAWCDITLNRLAANADGARLTMQASVTYRALTEHYGVLAESVYQHVHQLYDYRDERTIQLPDEQDYKVFVDQYQHYGESGANQNQLAQLESLAGNSQEWSSVQTLYREIALDLYHDTGNSDYLTRLKQFLPSARHAETEGQMLNQFALARAQRDYDAARAFIPEFEALGTSPLKLAETKGLLALTEGEYQAAVDHFDNALKLRPSAQNHFRLSMAHWLTGNVGAAWAHIDKAHSLNPGDHKTTSFRGLIALWEGRLPEARDAFDQVLQSERTAIVLNNLGLVYMLERQYSKAQSLFTESLSRAPGDPQGLLNSADTTLLMKDSSARQQYLQLLEVTEGNTDVMSLRARAQALAQLGHFKAALEAYQQVRELDPNSGDTHYVGALVYSLAGEHISAQLAAQEALSTGMGAVWFSMPWFASLCGQGLFASETGSAATGCPAAQ